MIHPFVIFYLFFEFNMDYRRIRHQRLGLPIPLSCEAHRVPSFLNYPEICFLSGY